MCRKYFTISRVAAQAVSYQEAPTQNPAQNKVLARKRSLKEPVVSARPTQLSQGLTSGCIIMFFQINALTVGITKNGAITNSVAIHKNNTTTEGGL